MRAGTSKSRFNSVLKTTLLLAGSITVALALGELLVRVAQPQQLVLTRPDIWRPADSLGWTNTPNVRTTINTGDRTVSLSTDERGYRIGRRGRVEAPTRVLILGDSYMAALAVEHEQSVPGLLEVGLETRLGRPVAVRNAGVDGWNPSQYLIQERRSLREERFAVVVVALYLGNDIVKARQSYFPPRPYSVGRGPKYKLRVPDSFDFEGIREAVLYPIRNYWESRSHLFQLVKEQTVLLRTRLGLTTYQVNDVFLRSEASSSRWNTTADICRDIADVAMEYGLPTVFLLIPSVFQVDARQFDRVTHAWRIDASVVDPDQPNRKVIAALRSRGLEVWDSGAEIRSAIAAGESLYGTVDPHLNPRGHAVVAQFIEPAIVAHLVQDPVSGPQRESRHPSSPAYWGRPKLMQ